MIDHNIWLANSSNAMVHSMAMTFGIIDSFVTFFKRHAIHNFDQILAIDSPINHWLTG